MFGKSEEEKRRETEQKQLEADEQERAWYRRKFIVEIVPFETSQDIENDIDEKEKHGFEPVSISDIYHRYEQDECAILYKRKE